MEHTEQLDASVPQRSTTVEMSLAVAILVGVLVQAALAGQHIAVGGSISLHGVIGNAVFAAQLILVLLLIMRRFPKSAIVTAVVVTVLLVAQIGLGYASRASHDLVALHIPLGVALFGVATWQLAAIRSR